MTRWTSSFCCPVVIAALPVPLHDEMSVCVLDALPDSGLSSPLWARTRGRFERVELPTCEGMIVGVSVLAHVLPRLPGDDRETAEATVEDTLIIEWASGSTSVVRTNGELPGTLIVEVMQAGVETAVAPAAYRKRF